jgi:phosphoribosyl-ATP pyrophosphohydrolase/phosphoribosyl-AMP cyclohydrolase
MVIASIDIQNGKVVQLKQGAELVLERDNALELAAEFDRYGEIAVIDLDAAMGKGNNLEMIKPLLRKGECRVGGGIRRPEQAKELVSIGAKKIIIGSSAFRISENKGGCLTGSEFAVNVSLLEAMSKKIGRERLVIAVDARNGEIVVDGWKTPTGLDLVEAAKLVEPFAGELLFTCVEREGTMTGINFGYVEKLRAAVTCQITAAGGVTTLDEIARLAAIGCDVQLGMALYTGKINLADAFTVSLNWKKGEIHVPPGKNGERAFEQIRYGAGSAETPFITKSEESPSFGSLLPMIVQSPDGQVLMIGFTDAEALTETFKRGNVCFHSRTRNKLWMKGENSGNTLKLLRLRADCDLDALLVTAEPAGPVCHTGAWSCFSTDKKYSLEFLQNIIAERFRNPVPGSYTATLDDELVREKVQEEAKELCEAKTKKEIIMEAADVFYFSTALLTRAGISIQDVLDELDRRHKK